MKEKTNIKYGEEIDINRVLYEAVTHGSYNYYCHSLGSG